jgi:hypothetical protein
MKLSMKIMATLAADGLKMLVDICWNTQHHISKQSFLFDVHYVSTINLHVLQLFVVHINLF